MTRPGRLKIAVIGAGRMGTYHARYVQELARDDGKCELAAIVDPCDENLRRLCSALQPHQPTPIQAFRSVENLMESKCAAGAIIATPTESHHLHIEQLVTAGMRVMVEKPLTDSLASARKLGAYLSTTKAGKSSVMQAFMRRFDEPLAQLKSMVDSGAVGRVFKVVSTLEDPRPPHAGYKSAGIAADMAVHNVDEINWIAGASPQRVIGIGSQLFSLRTSDFEEDFDDALLVLRYRDDLIGQITVSRNHVACYRNETWVYGERGMIHVGQVLADTATIELEAYDRYGQQIAQQCFTMPACEKGAPPFVVRFGPAYKAETAHYVSACLSETPFAVDYRDGFNALAVVDGAQRSLREGGKELAVTIS